MERCVMKERCKPEYRSVLAAILMAEPSARAMFRLLRNLGATNMRPDYMYANPSICKCGCGNVVHERVPDFSVWHATCRGDSHVAMVRRGDDDWTLHS